MQAKVIHKLIWAQASYFGWLIICVFIDQGGFKNDSGLSFYGEHLRTFVPYALGTVGCSLLLARAAALLPAHEPPYRIIRWALRAVAVLLPLLLLTPDTLGQFLNLSHEIIAFILFIGELGLAAWLAIFWCRDFEVYVLAAMQLASGLVAMLSEFNVTHYLSQASLVFQLSFNVLLMRAIRLLPETGEKTAADETTGKFRTRTL